MSAPPVKQPLADTILQATAALIEEQGIDAVTMRAVAARIGYSATTIYLYFRNKDDLLGQALLYARDALFASLSPAGEPLDMVSYLESIAVGLVRWGIEHPNLYALIFERADGDRSIEAVGQSRELWEGTLGMLKQAIDQGVITHSGDPEIVGQIAWALLHGIIWLARSDRLIPPQTPHTREDTARRAELLAREFAAGALGLRRPNAPAAGA